MMTARRRDLLGVIVSLIVIAITSTLIVVVNAGHASDRGEPLDPLEVVASDATLLLQFRDEDGSAVGNVIVAGGASASMLALPPTLLVPTPQQVPLRDTPGERDTLAARNGVSALLGVRVDAVVTLDRLALAALIDGVGGAPLDVPSRFVERDATGAVRLAIFPGARVLPGTSAAAYAMVRQEGEPEAARMARLMAVTGQVLTAVPSGTDDLRALVVSLGASARSTVGADALAAGLVRIRAAVAGGLTMQALPVTALVGDAASVPREPEATAVVRDAMPHALLAAGQSPLPRIVLRRAGASALELMAARTRLADASMAVVGVLSTGGASQAEGSSVIVPDGSAAALARGIEVATVLGLPATAVRAAPEPPPLPQADAVVSLGPNAMGLRIG